MEKAYLCTQIVRERAAPRQRASSLHSVCTVLVTRISKGMQIFLLLNLSHELRPRTRFNEQIQMYIEAAHHSADFNHSTFGAVAGLCESMGRGLRFLYAFELVLSPQI